MGERLEKFPDYIPIEIISERLPIILPEGTPNRNICLRESSIRTIFCFIYIGAIEGSGQTLAPRHVYLMTEEHSKLSSDEDRLKYIAHTTSKKKNPISGIRWYEDNSREQIRDEVIRNGLTPLGIVDQTTEVTTSKHSRYFLKSHFISLLNPELKGEALKKAIEEWQAANLSKSAFTRISLLKYELKTENVIVDYPTGESRPLSPGQSSIISKAVIMEFAKRFMVSPFVLWLSESGNKVVTRDDSFAKKLGLTIEPEKMLVDIILVDYKLEDPLFVFVEVVATDGPVTELRRNTISEMMIKSGFKQTQIAFVTAYSDRESPGFKKTMSSLAWNSFAWFLSEPDNIITLTDGSGGVVPLHLLNNPGSHIPGTT